MGFLDKKNSHLSNTLQMEAFLQFLLRIFLHHHQNIPHPNLARILFTIPSLIHYFDLIRDLTRYPDFDGPDCHL